MLGELSMLTDMDIHISGLRSRLEFDLCFRGKSLVEDKVKISSYTAIMLREARSGA